jgi:hypothetical protein
MGQPVAFFEVISPRPRASADVLQRTVQLAG